MTEFLPDLMHEEAPVTIEGAPIAEPCGVIPEAASEEACTRGAAFAREIADNMISDFRKEGDFMVHVSSYAILGGMIYMTYYANTTTPDENPRYHRARLVYCPVDDVENKTYIDLQAAGDLCGGKTVDDLYDTILLRKDDETLYLMWTARLSGNYYRLYRTYHIPSGTLSEIQPNRLKIGDILSDFNITDMCAALSMNNLGVKNLYSDIGIMQKLTSRVENGETYYYTGAYCGDFNFIIKSRDLITWEYVAQPDFINQSQWENAVYVIGDKCYYFVRQKDCRCGFLTCYHLDEQRWERPLLVGDSQSRGDFILYEGELYLFHAPIDREHIGILHVDQADIARSRVVLQAHMHESCFYPFIQYGEGGLYFSYTSARKHIQLSKFDPARQLLP